MFNNEIFPPNYAIYRKDRSSCGGGVILAIDMSIPSRIVPSPDNIEVVVAEVLSSKPFRICVLYNPPKSKLDYQRYSFLTCFKTLNLLF